MSSLMIGVSGVRGIVGDTMTPELTLGFARAFGTYLGGGSVVVARDTRTSGEMLRHALLSGLISAGCRVIDVGIVPTPTASVAVTHLAAAGAVIITGSHNPIEWNALKFMGPDGVCLSEAEGEKLLEVRNVGEYATSDWAGLKPIEECSSAGDVHTGKVLGNVDADLIRSRRFTVALDSVNGAGSLVTPVLLVKLGCRVVKVHCAPDGRFPHNPEPTRENLKELCRVVADGDFDVGFAQDSDADRLAIVDESGAYIGEEYTLALGARQILSTTIGPVAANLSSSRMIDDVAAHFGVDVKRTKVGEANVAAGMIENHCVAGGEGNGGIIDPRTCYTRDSLSGMALVLEMMAGLERPLSEIVGEFPSYAMAKEKFSCTRESVAAVLEAVRGAGDSATVNELDGVRLDWPERWVHVRASNTEPAVRVIAEAPSERQARELAGRFMELSRRAAG